MEKITEIKEEKQRVKIVYDDGSKVLIPNTELLRIKRGITSPSVLRETVKAFIIPWGSFP